MSVLIAILRVNLGETTLPQISSFRFLEETFWIEVAYIFMGSCPSYHPTTVSKTLSETQSTNSQQWLGFTVS